MASATGRDGQASGLGLRLELAQGPGGPRVRLHAGPADLAPGLRLATLVAEPVGEDRPRSTAALREGSWRALEARLEVSAEALEGAARALCGVTIGTWPIGHVSVDAAGESVVLTLAGPRDDGWPALAQIELGVAVEAGEIAVRARRVWATGPLAPSATAVWQAAARGLSRGREGAVRLDGATLRLAPEWLVRRAFRAAGAVPPRTRGLQVARVRGEGRGLRVVLADVAQGTGSEGHARQGMSERTGMKGHVFKDMSDGPEDPLAELRAALRAGDRAAALTALSYAPAPTHPGARRLTRALAQVQAELLRFHDRAGAAAAVRAWLAAAPDDPEAWWRVIVAQARAGEPEGVVRGLAALERVPGPPAVRQRRRVARALVEAEQLGAGGRARAVLEDMSWSGGPAAQAEGWRALAIARAGDPQVAGEQVEAAVSAALDAGVRCERAWCEAAELHARVAAAGRRCGRDVAEAERAASEIVEAALRLAREERLTQLGSVIVGQIGRADRRRVRTELQTRAARSLDAGAMLALAEMVEETGERGRARALRQVAGFLLPGCRVEDENEPEACAASEGSPREAWGAGEEGGEPREAIRGCLRELVTATAGIRAARELTLLDLSEAMRMQAIVEPEVARLRAATGLRLPVRVGRGGPEGGVAIRNEREPAIVVYPAIERQAERERRFRLALAAELVRGGLAIVLDPAGASLHELLAALAWLGEPSQPPTLPGAQTIVRLWQKRGVSPEQFTPELRARLCGQLGSWRTDAASVTRLATLLRGDHCVAAARLAGAFDGALLAIGRDARLPAPVDEASARQVCATDEAQRLFRGAGLFFAAGDEHV
ncbi:hypothetical protein OV090_40490 [Nannocystis sp. RBIL2]|uniref:hypothetical protein n=1 Tax=Nannocystis sp. RBIL2 TaxID=2996788 RepID=UPI0022715BDE|nr:hypothetical protein [Nannocystis sp. RBIL2]MCY1071091.1 hypothetical protein [Nannocystis sp. RBIL2]